MSAKRFRIAFSFAGEKRPFVAEVAAILAQKFGEAAILYDRFHRAEFAVDDLAAHLTQLYRDDADLIVAVLCHDYDNKDWCGLEWKTIRGLLKQGDRNKIMLTRFDLVKPEAMEGLAGYLDLDHETPESATSLILERLALNEGYPKVHYTKPTFPESKPARTSTPNNLPSLQPFFGRTSELATIREALDPDPRTWGALIDGPGGMGKTSLAVRAAYDCPPGLFQRIVFVSVKDREMDDDCERPLGNLLVPGFLEMLNELARELGQPDIAKSPEDQRIRLLLDALRPAQALLILDNLESLPKTDRDQLFTFVNRLPQGCKAILTSRRRIGAGSMELILEKLDQEAALATLADLARRNPLLARTSEAERIALYTQTAGKPLPLRWVAGQLGRGSCRTVDHALAFLRSCPPDNDPLEFIFGDLAKEFTTDEEKVLCALTYFSLPAKVEHIAEVAGIEETPTETALRTLANRSLIVPDQDENCYTLVPMVAEFLRKHRAGVVAHTGRRLEQYAFSLIIENGLTNYDRFPALDAAWPILVSALPLLVSGPDDRIQTIADAFLPFLDFSGRWDELVSLARRAEATALAASNFSRAATRAYYSGIIHASRNEADDAIRAADRASDHREKGGGEVGEWVAVLQLRGHGYLVGKNYSAAVEAFKGAVALTRSLGSAGPLGSCLNDLANGERLIGEHASSKAHLSEALHIAKGRGDDEGIAIFTGNLALASLDQKDWSAAETLARSALSVSEKVGRAQLIADNCRRLAKALARQGKTAEGLPFAQRAVAFYDQSRSRELTAGLEALQECES